LQTNSIFKQSETHVVVGASPELMTYATV